jgi:hypothetical protein
MVLKNFVHQREELFCMACWMLMCAQAVCARASCVCKELQIFDKHASEVPR